jgi:hypothetical protein
MHVADHRLPSRCSQTDYQLRPKQNQFRFQPRLASGDDAPFASFLELEMLHRMCDIYVRGIDAGLFQRLVQEHSCRPYKRMAGEIFFIARLFSDHCNARRRPAFTENGLRGAAVQFGALASLHRFARLRQYGVRRYECPPPAIFFITGIFVSRNICRSPMASFL